MESNKQRTDLALEARELAKETSKEDIEGVEYEEKDDSGIKYQKLTVTNQVGADSIGKPIGTYYTASISSVLRRESETFDTTVEVLAKLIQGVMSDGDDSGSTLVVGLGNRDITPDNIGPLCTEHVLVTRHLKEHAPEDFKFLSSVAVISPGVMGTSGIESADYIKWVCSNLKPKQVIVVDALAARSLDRICRTIQITDTGITPGSGVGNSRMQINKETLGVPVIALGVPTVVDIRTLLSDMGNVQVSNDVAENNEMIVTPRNIDSEVVCASKVIAYAINIALHKGISIEDVDMLVG